MKKILIFYASYGGGHLNAAKSINEYLINNYKDISVEIIDCMKYVNKPIEKVSAIAYRELAKNAPWVWGKLYNDSQKGPVAHISARSNEILAIKLLKLLRLKKPDLIISTHPFGSQMCSYLKRKGKINAKIATIMTDFASHDQWLIGSDFTDYFFVSNEKMKKSLQKKSIPENKIFVTGIPLSNKFLQKYDKEKIMSEFGLEKNKKTILFFGGGEFGLGKSRTFEIFETFVQNCINTQIIAIAGKNEKMKLAFEEIVIRNNAQNFIHILGFSNKIPELMSIADFVVTKPGGLTTTESLASHLPIIIINPIPGQERENAKFLVSKGVAIWIKRNTNVSEVINTLYSTPDKLEEMKFNTKLLAKPNSTKDICQILLDN